MKRKISDFESNIEDNNSYQEEDLINLPKRTKYEALEDVGDLKLSINNIEAKELKRRRSGDNEDMERQVRRKIAVCDDCDDFTSVVDPSIKPHSLDIIVHPEAKKHELLNNYKDVVQNMVFSNLTRMNTLRSMPVIPYREYRGECEDENEEQNGWSNSESPFPPTSWPLIPGYPPNARILCPKCQKEKSYCECPKEDINISFPDDLEVD